jgi:hypothetical protein
VRAGRSPKEERAAARAQGQAEQEQSDRLAAVAFTPDSETVRKAPLRAFLADFDRFTAFLKNNPPAQIAPALSGSDWIWIENGIIFTFRKWCDEMEREMNAGIRVIGGTDA